MFQLSNYPYQNADFITWLRILPLLLSFCVIFKQFAELGVYKRRKFFWGIRLAWHTEFHPPLRDIICGGVQFL
jgi:hypothetical protein